MGTIALQIERLMSGIVPDKGNVIFNSVAHIGGNITFDGMTGVVTLHEPGRYSINWWVTVQPSKTTSFTLYASTGDVLKGTPPGSYGEVSGSGAIQVGKVPITLQLVNTSGTELNYPDRVPVKAKLSVTNNSMAAEMAKQSMPQKPAVSVEIPKAPLEAAASLNAQLVYVLTQLIRLYPGNWTVFTSNIYSVTGVPNQLYTTPQAPDTGFLVLVDDGKYEAFPLEDIIAIHMGERSVYNPAITYLPAPSPASAAPESARPAALLSYLPLMTEVSLLMGSSVQASGLVFKNEYGMLVLSDVNGNMPVFIPTDRLSAIISDTLPVPGSNPPAADEKQRRKPQRPIKKVKVSIQNPLPKNKK